MLVVVDTNIWISAALSPRGYCAPIVDLVLRRRVTPVICPATLREITLVLTRPRFVERYAVAPEEIARLLRAVTRRSFDMPDPEVEALCRDPRDDIFVALASASGAAFLVTRDDDLKGDARVVERLAATGCDVITIQKFFERLAE